MTFFINSGVFRNNRCKLKRKISNGIETILTLPNYDEKTMTHTEVKFVFGKCKWKNISNDHQNHTFKNVKLSMIDENNYKVTFSEENVYEYEMFALIRSDAAFPDDIFIPLSMKSNIEVIRRFRFTDIDNDNKEFLSNVYLVKISLSDNETLPIYLSSEYPSVLDNHIVISCSCHGYKISTYMQTHIALNKKNRDEYISLSKKYIENQDEASLLSDKQKIILVTFYLMGIDHFFFRDNKFELYSGSHLIQKFCFKFNSNHEELNFKVLDGYFYPNKSYELRDIIHKFCPEYIDILT